jgi:hypothetical protein
VNTIVVLALVGGYAALPSKYRSASKLATAAAIAVAATVIDTYGAILGARLAIRTRDMFSSGFFYMGDLSREQLAAMQTKLQVCTPLSIVLGIIAGIVLVSAVRATAVSCEAKSFAAMHIVARFGPVRTLMVVTGVGAVGVVLVVRFIRDGMTILTLGGVLLTLALVTMGLLVRALFGLARVLDFDEKSERVHRSV